MGQWDVHNAVLLVLNEKPLFFLPLEKMDAVCEQLRLDNLITAIIREDTAYMSSNTSANQFKENHTEYAILSTGRMLIADLPPDYTGKPYDYFLKKKQDAIDAETNFKELIAKTQKSTIETTKWTKYMYRATLAIAVGTFLLAIYPFFQQLNVHTEIQQIQDTLRQMQRSLGLPTQSLSPDASVKSKTLAKDSAKPSLKGK